MSEISFPDDLSLSEPGSGMPQVGDHRVWYIPQVPMPAFYATFPGCTIEIAQAMYNLLIDFSQFELDHNVKPDYSDAIGIQRLDKYGDWEELEWDDEKSAWGAV
jgi:hypothetical protein